MILKIKQLFGLNKRRFLNHVFAKQMISNF